MGTTSQANGNEHATGQRAIAPSKFAHVVYKTHKFDELIDWYIKVFNAKVQHRDDRLAFLTYDAEHHRFAFVNLVPPRRSVRAARGRLEFTTSPIPGTTSASLSKPTSA